MPLLRGADAPAGAEVRLLKFLNGLCERNPKLYVCLLAWDFHIVLAGEREWLQRVFFHWMTHSHLHFRVDDAPVTGGSHHQKFVVIDGRLAFLGGMDLRDACWDDRRHLTLNPDRSSRRSSGAATSRRAARCRSARPGSGCAAPSPGLTVRPSARSSISFSTRSRPPSGSSTSRPSTSSRRVREALVHRMRDTRRPRLEIVVVVNERAEAIKEEIAVGLRSMGIDSELHASWEATDANPGLEDGIRRVRVDLLAEHAGIAAPSALEALVFIAGLVGRLEAIAGRPGARLQRHGPPSAAQRKLLAVLDPDALPFDSDGREPADEHSRRTPRMALRRVGAALRDRVARVRRPAA